MDVEPHLTRHILRRSVLTGLITGALAPCVYVAVTVIDALLGYVLFPPWTPLPEPMFSIWVVAPGAAALGACASCSLRFQHLELKPRLLQGTVLGVLLGPLNVPLSVMVALVPYRLHGGSNPIWLGRSWANELDRMILHSLPVSIPCAVLLGLVVGSLSGPDERSKREAEA
jgi:hypothetical protein